MVLQQQEAAPLSEAWQHAWQAPIVHGKPVGNPLGKKQQWGTTWVGTNMRLTIEIFYEL